MEERHLSKKELKALRKLEELEQKTAEQKNNFLKWIVISISSLVFLGLFGFIIINSKSSSSTSEPIQLTTKGWVRGKPESPVTLVEFSDFQCPACKYYEPTIQKVIKEYDGKVRLLYKHFPLKQAHKNAVTAAKAAEAAGIQGKFWEMHDKLFDAQEDWAELGNPDDKFASYAKELGLDESQFKKDYSSKETEAKITDFENEGIEAGVVGTPSFFLNGKKLEVKATLEDFKAILDPIVAASDK